MTGKGSNPNSQKNLKPFRKGTSGNPNGGRRHDPVKRRLKRVTAPELEDLIQVAMTSNLDELKRIIQNPTSTAIQVGIATSLVKAIQRGDWKIIDAIVERLIGKVPVAVDHTSGGKAMGSSAQVHLYLPANGRTKEENEAAT